MSVCVRTHSGHVAGRLWLWRALTMAGKSTYMHSITSEFCGAGKVMIKNEIVTRAVHPEMLQQVLDVSR